MGRSFSTICDAGSTARQPEQDHRPSRGISMNAVLRYTIFYGDLETLQRLWREVVRLERATDALTEGVYLSTSGEVRRIVQDFCSRAAADQLNGWELGALRGFDASCRTNMSGGEGPSPFDDVDRLALQSACGRLCHSQMARCRRMTNCFDVFQKAQHCAWTAAHAAEHAFMFSADVLDRLEAEQHADAFTTGALAASIEQGIFHLYRAKAACNRYHTAVSRITDGQSQFGMDYIGGPIEDAGAHLALVAADLRARLTCSTSPASPIERARLALAQRYVPLLSEKSLRETDEALDARLRRELDKAAKGLP